MINPEGEFNPNMPYYKIVDYDKVPIISKLQRDGGKVVVLTTGVYDIFHYKHAESLSLISSLGDFTIVGIPGDLEVKNAVGNGAQDKDVEGVIVDYDKRAKIVAHLPYVDLIFKKTTDKFDLITNIKPNILVQSITSGEKVITEILEMTTKLESKVVDGNLILDIGDVKCTTIFIDDIENGNTNIVPVMFAVEKARIWQGKKFEENMFHGSMIKRKIIEREIARSNLVKSK